MRSDRHRERAMALVGQFDEPVRHLDFESEMAPFVDGTIDAAGAEIVESHLEDCGICRGEIEDLRRVATPRRRWRAVSIAAAAALLVTSVLAAVWLSRPRPVQPHVRPAAQAERALPAEWQRLVDETLAAGRLPVSPHLAALQSGTTTLRGATPSRTAVEPDGVIVETTLPRFRWPEAPQGTYRVFVYSDEQEVAVSAPLRRTDWIPARPLHPGRTYEWQVETTSRGTTTIAPAPVPARFRTVAGLEHLELAQARATGDPLVLAILYSRIGLADLARAELEKLAGSPDPRVQRLLRSYDASPKSTKPAQ